MVSIFICGSDFLFCEVGFNHGFYFVVNRRGGAEGSNPIEILAWPFGGDGPSAFGDEAGGGDIPEVESRFVIAIGSTAGHMTDIDGGRADHANFTDVGSHFIKEGEGAWIDVFGESGKKGRFFEGWNLRGVNGVPITKSGGFNRGAVTFVEWRNVDAPCDDGSIVPDGNGATPTGEIARIVRRAVNGINDPFEGMIRRDGPFFSENGMIWKVSENDLFGESLAFAIHDQLDIVVEAFDDFLASVKVLPRMESSGFCGFDADV